MIDTNANNTSEIYCTVCSTDKFEEIEKYLSILLGRKITINDDVEYGKCIEFYIEHGDDYYIILSDFINLLNKVLSDAFGETNFLIRTNV